MARKNKSDNNHKQSDQAKAIARQKRDDGVLQPGEQMGSLSFNNANNNHLKRPHVRCGVCGWYLRFDNIETHFAKFHPGFNDFAVATLQETLFWYCDIDPVPQGVHRGHYPDTMKQRPTQ